MDPVWKKRRAWEGKVVSLLDPQLPQKPRKNDTGDESDNMGDNFLDREGIHSSEEHG
jgi:hypothetical protein